MYCLFEVGVFFSRFYVGKRRTRDEDNEAENEKAEAADKTEE
jgi:sec-independent protein translocase protein TatC